LKHHIRQRVRHLRRVATLAATATAIAAPAASARAEGARISPRAARTTMPLDSIGAVKSEMLPGSVPQRISRGTKAKAEHMPQASATSSAQFASTIARSNRLVRPRSLDAASLPLLATRPEKASRPALLADAGTPAMTIITHSAADAVPASSQVSTSTSTDNRVLLAQLDAELRETQNKLDSTDEKLSDGQRELLGLSNTLRSVMLQDGDNAAGLHPFVRVASRYAGTPYVWGGESRYGFDCSGFIIRVMRDLGYHALPHSAAEQFKYGQPVAQALLKPGDLVFFANTYKPGISHVGIYIGKRRFIHAASTRLGTIISSLDSQPYSRKYAGARRLVAAQKT
jgi:cell wall-associated NlpC family hydrolase